MTHNQRQVSNIVIPIVESDPGEYNMYTVIVFPGGRQVDALLLAASAERLRVAIPGRGDTTEFQLIEGRWTTESGGHVELGAILAADSAGAERVLANTFARALSAA